MDQGIVPSQLPLHPDYDETEQQDSFGGFTAHAHHPATYTNPAVDLSRDAPLHGDIGHVFPYTAANTPRYALPSAGISPDPSSFRPAHGLGEADPSSSFSPHTSSSETTHPYAYSPHNYTHLPPALYPNIQGPSLYHPGSAHAVGRLPSVPEGLALDVQPRFRPQELPSIPRGGPFFNPLIGNRPAPPGSAFGPLLEAPRPTHFAGLLTGQENFPVIPPLPRPQPQQSPSTQSQNEHGPFPFPTMDVDREVSSNGRPLGVTIHASVDKGFFSNEGNGTQEWTCYRRNYFSLTGYFILDPYPASGGTLYVVVNGRREPISAFGMKLVANVADGANGNGKTIELVQHTPKRDNGPKNRIEIVKVSPSSGHDEHHNPNASFSTTTLGGYQPAVLQGPYLPCQNEPDPVPAAASNNQPQYNTAAPAAQGNSGTATGIQTRHVFERIQFKQATANNGKRRASQQYFQLVVELHADIRQPGSTEPHWVRVATRTSERIVVRGRSPSHYQGGDNSGRPGGGGGGHGGGHGGSAGSPFLFPNAPSTYGNLQSNGGRAPHHTGYGGAMTAPPGNYRTHYRYDGGDHATSASPTDIAGGVFPPSGALEGGHTAILDRDQYEYYPQPIYEATTQPMQPGQRITQLPVPKVEDTLRRSTDPGQYAVRHEYPYAVPGAQWSHQPLERFQPAPSSVNYYPDLRSGPHVATAPHPLGSVVEQPGEEVGEEHAHPFQ